MRPAHLASFPLSPPSVPLANLSTSVLLSPFLSCSRPQALNEYFEEEDVEDVDPDDFFEGERITLEKTKQYEDALKAKLQYVPHSSPPAFCFSDAHMGWCRVCISPPA